MSDKGTPVKIAPGKTPVSTVTPTLPRKPTNKVAIPRLYNAVEDIVIDAGLTGESTIHELFDAFGKAIVKAARGL